MVYKVMAPAVSQTISDDDPRISNILQMIYEWWNFLAEKVHPLPDAVILISVLYYFYISGSISLVSSILFYLIKTTQ